MAFVASLPPLRGDGKTVADIAREMYLPGGEHVERLAAFGKTFCASTLQAKRGYLREIVGRFGAHDVRDIEARTVSEWLLASGRGAGWNKHCLAVLREVFEEASWRGVKVSLPAMPSFTEKYKSADIFSGEELRRLFRRENFENSNYGAEKPYLLFLVSAVAGLRVGEARGLRVRQFLFARGALVVDGFLRGDGTRTSFNKAGNEDDRKIRIVLLPDGVAGDVRRFVEREGKAGDDFVFTHDGVPLSYDILKRIFSAAVSRAGIDVAGRKLTPHSLRFTYVTKMRRTLPIDTVRKLVGHTADKMTEYYTRASVEDGLAGIAGTKEAVEHLFD